MPKCAEKICGWLLLYIISSSTLGSKTIQRTKNDGYAPAIAL